jgi:catechol 2,3-dioxygenase-like lactoylglutathione lyase family enzyme
MLKDRDILATVAVKDLTAARKFYEQTLGLAPVAAEGDQVVIYRTGGCKLMVYKSQYAGTNKATAATWIVGDEIDEMVKTLRGKGVSFEHYDMPGMKLEGDVHVMGDMRNAWFKDPDGNILSVVNGQMANSRAGSV